VNVLDPQIENLIISYELWSRPTHTPDLQTEAAAIRRLADTMADDPSKMLQVCVEVALEQCRADTCGISVYERTETGEEIFRWVALTGVLKEHLHGTTPRHFSPCGVCVEAGAPILMRRPELIYKYLDVGPPFNDVLLIPLSEKGSKLEGTIWVVAHDPARKFDAEDARLMQRIAIFTSAALQMAGAVDEARSSAQRAVMLSQELDHRVQNALQMTASLLRLQLADVSDPVAREAIETAGRRVSAIGNVHRIGAQAAQGNLAAVARSVCADLIVLDKVRPDIRIDAEEIVVPAHKAALVALILHELVTNAVKHGLQRRARGRLTIDVHRRSDGLAALSVSDDGPPLPMSGEHRVGLGLRLVGGLADQLGGTFEVIRQPKSFRVAFPI